MKKFASIILCSLYVLVGGCLFFVPLFLGISAVCRYCGMSPVWAERVSLVLITSIVVGWGTFWSDEDSRSEGEKASKELAELKEIFEHLQTETGQSAPWFAAKIADAAVLADKDAEIYLRYKKRPALKAADQVKEISREKRELVQKNKELEYQLQFYESLFPWLEEFKTIPAPEAVEYVHSTDSDYDRVRSWISPEEYATLSSAQKNQLALDRYKNRKKSDWDVGIEYERYIGYLYENGGRRVIYNGATEGLSDMGRDIIAFDGERVVVIQCKRWSKEKEIHEKHIFQLYGSVILMQIQTDLPCVGRFVTTAHLSPTAKECADYLGIECFEGYEYKDYPQIKCNVAKDGERIYHLPFDQQYDRVQISGKKGAMFAWTVAEAEKNGFRHAHRWIPDAFQGLPLRNTFGYFPRRKTIPVSPQSFKNEKISTEKKNSTPLIKQSIQKENSVSPIKKSSTPKKQSTQNGKKPTQIKKTSKSRKSWLESDEFPLHPDFAVPYRERYSGKSISKEAGVPDGFWFDEDDLPHCEALLGVDPFQVFGSPKGKLYHAPDCSRMRNAMEMNLCAAIAEGRTPCPYCHPSTEVPPWVSEYQKISRLRRQCSIDMLP